jgi:hypothetical protein
MVKKFSESKLIETVLSQSLEIHLLQKEIDKLQFLCQAQKAKMKKAKNHTLKN